MTGARRPFGLTSIDVEAGFRPDLEDVVTNVTATTHPDGNGWSVRGDTTVGTDLVATFTRSTYTGRDGIVAKHIRLDATPHFQGQGYAKSLLKASFRLYQHIGVAYVE